MSKRRLPTVVLALLAVAALAGAGCGGKSGNSSEQGKGSTTEGGAHKRPSHAPAY